MATNISITYGSAPTETKYGDIDIQSSSSTYLIQGVSASSQSSSTATTAVQLTGTYGSYVNLVTYNLTGTGYSTLYEFTDQLICGTAATPWGTITLGTSPYINLGYQLTLRNTTTSTNVAYDYVDNLSFYNGTNYLFLQRPYLSFIATTTDGDSYTLKVDWIIRRSSGTGTLSALYSSERTLKTTEMRF